MKTKKLWGIGNLVLAAILFLTIVWLWTFEINAHDNALEQTAENSQLAAGIGAAVVIIASLIFSVAHGVCALLLVISGVGLLAAKKRGFFIVGIVGELLAVGAFIVTAFLSVSLFSTLLQLLLAAIYLGIGIAVCVLLAKKKI